MSSESTGLESASNNLLGRSKSHDQKLESTDVSESPESSTTPKKKDSNEPKIIVTSFAPNPKAKQIPQSIGVRPSSYLFRSQRTDATEKDDEYSGSRKLNIVWPNGKSDFPVIIFSPKVLKKAFSECKKIGEHYRLTYKFSNGEKKLIKALLDGHGFREAHPNSSEFNLIWTGNNLKTYAFRSLQLNQKVNHFPRSCEITRKDRLYKNVQKMGKEKGVRAFNFLPLTFVMPFEIDEFYNTFYKERGLWIVKPASLSRGRGIFLINHPDQIPLEDNLIVSKYISNPLLIEGFKFDLRLYVAVTSFDPLVFYLYEEGLTRFATIKYDQNQKNMKNTCMHLTNYSLNKKSEKYVHCNDPDVEDYGNKWSMGALLRFLVSQGKDTFGLMMNIEEIIIKTMLSVESPLASAARMFVPNRGNCFELFGFDILIDKELKPWVIEVNLSPSLDCDALLDIKIKSSMVSDLFTLTGIYCQNPATFTNRSRYQKEQNNTRARADPKARIRPHSAHSGSSSSNLRGATEPGLYDNISPTEQEILKTVIDEEERSNCWIRLFPTTDTWEHYAHYLENRSTSYNQMLHRKLYPRRWQSGGHIKRANQSRSKILQALFNTHRDNLDAYHGSETTGVSLADALERYKRYERRLKDPLRPNEDTLKRFTHNFNIHQSLNHSISLKTNSNMFPHGDLKSSKQHSKYQQISSDSSSDDDFLREGAQGLATDSSNNSRNFKNDKDTRKPLPTITTTSNKQLASIDNHNKRISSSRTPLGSRSRSRQLTRGGNKAHYDYDSKDDYSSDDLSDDGEDSLEISTDKPTEIKYDLETIMKFLNDGYYISRIQIRNAFALYLFKIHVRLVAESQFKDDCNNQQMDLVMRFIKKAAPNLSQEFKVYVPSKRLPLCEQKRMLAKELHDFLHIYRKDTGQIRLELASQLESERRSKKYRNKLIDEKAFQTLLYKCCEAELEEIMSVYMKNSHDTSVFLGASKNPNKNTETIDPNCFNLTQYQSQSDTSVLAISSTLKSSSKDQSIISLNTSETNPNTEPKSPPKTYSKSAYAATTTRLKSSKKSLKDSPSKSHENVTEQLEKPKPKNKKSIKSVKPQRKRSEKVQSGEELSELSCDSFITNSSDESIKNAPSLFQSRSLSRNSSVLSAANTKRLHVRNKSKDKTHKIQGGLSMHREYSKYANQSDVIELNNDKDKSKKMRKSPLKNTPSNNKISDQEITMTQIYTSGTSFDKKPITKKTPATLILQAGAKKAPLQSSLGSTDKPPQQETKRLHQVSISSNHSPNAKLNAVNPSTVFIHRHTVNNGSSPVSPLAANNLETTTCKSTDISICQGIKTSVFKDNNAEEYANITRELRNLNLRQHERVYSAAKSSFRLASSLCSDDQNVSFMDTNRSKIKVIDDFNNGQRNGSLIDHLERQKEKTSRLLQKSKAKHSEMISMSLIKN